MLLAFEGQPRRIGAEFFDEPPLEKLAPLGGSAVREATSVGAKFPTM